MNRFSACSINNPQTRIKDTGVVPTSNPPMPVGLGYLDLIKMALVESNGLGFPKKSLPAWDPVEAVYTRSAMCGLSRY